MLYEGILSSPSALFKRTRMVISLHMVEREEQDYVELGCHYETTQSRDGSC